MQTHEIKRRLELAKRVKEDHYTGTGLAYRYAMALESLNQAPLAAEIINDRIGNPSCPATADRLYGISDTLSESYLSLFGSVDKDIGIAGARSSVWDFPIDSSIIRHFAKKIILKPTLKFDYKKNHGYFFPFFEYANLKKARKNSEFGRAFVYKMHEMTEAAKQQTISELELENRPNTVKALDERIDSLLSFYRNLDWPHHLSFENAEKVKSHRISELKYSFEVRPTVLRILNDGLGKHLEYQQHALRAFIETYRCYSYIDTLETIKCLIDDVNKKIKIDKLDLSEYIEGYKSAHRIDKKIFDFIRRTVASRSNRRFIEDYIEEKLWREGY